MKNNWRRSIGTTQDSSSKEKLSRGNVREDVICWLVEWGTPLPTGAEWPELKLLPYLRNAKVLVQITNLSFFSPGTENMQKKLNIRIVTARQRGTVTGPSAIFFESTDCNLQRARNRKGGKIVAIYSKNMVIRRDSILNSFKLWYIHWSENSINIMN